MNFDSPSESVVAEQQGELWHYQMANRPRTPPSEPKATLAPARPRKQAGPSHLPAPAPKPGPENLEMIATLQAMGNQLQVDTCGGEKLAALGDDPRKRLPLREPEDLSLRGPRGQSA